MKKEQGFAELWFAGVVVVGLGVLLYFVHQESKRERAEWEQFKVAHICRKVSYEGSRSMPVSGFDSKGNATFSSVYVPARTGWLCDDGITYVRED